MVFILNMLQIVQFGETNIDTAFEKENNEIYSFQILFMHMHRKNAVSKLSFL